MLKKTVCFTLYHFIKKKHIIWASCFILKTYIWALRALTNVIRPNSICIEAIPTSCNARTRRCFSERDNGQDCLHRPIIIRVANNRTYTSTAKRVVPTTWAERRVTPTTTAHDKMAVSGINLLSPPPTLVLRGCPLIQCYNKEMWNICTDGKNPTSPLVV